MSNSQAVPEDFWAEYTCPACTRQWTLRTYLNNQAAKCPKCYHQSKPTSLTSYHGEEKVFGHFECPNVECKRTWKSHNSWANAATDCLGCKTKVYPFKQEPKTEKSANKENNPCNPAIHHQTDLCGRCRELGYDCSRGPPKQPAANRSAGVGAPRRTNNNSWKPNRGRGGRNPMHIRPIANPGTPVMPRRALDRNRDYHSKQGCCVIS